jgi:hypothetical protein
MEQYLESIFAMTTPSDDRVGYTDAYMEGMSVEEKLKFCMMLYNIIGPAGDDLDFELRKLYGKFHDKFEDNKDIKTYSMNDLDDIWIESDEIIFRFSHSYCGCCPADEFEKVFPIKFITDFDGYCEDVLKEVELRKVAEQAEKTKREQILKEQKLAKELAQLKELQEKYPDGVPTDV